MERTRVVRFVGGPLHGESRTVTNAKAEYRVAFSVATALALAMGEEEVAAPPEQGDLVYARRKDGRYYLRAEAPAAYENVPAEGFTFDWFDVSNGVLLVEITGPRSDIGYTTVDLMVSPEFLADPENMEQGAILLLTMGADTFGAREREAIQNLSPGAVRTLADGLEAGTPASLERGNRRMAALILRAWTEHRHAPR